MNASKLLADHVFAISRLNGLSAWSAAAILAIAATTATAATYGENFENFPNSSGSTVFPTGGYGTFNSSNHTANAVVNSDATAYDGTHYLQLQDTFSSDQEVVDQGFYNGQTANGAQVSFALRVDSSIDPGTGNASRNGAGVIVSSNDQNNGVLTQVKIVNNGDFGFYTYNGTPNTATFTDLTTSPSTTSGANPSGITATLGDWYFFKLIYAVSSAGAGTFSLSITDNNTQSTTSFANLSGETVGIDQSSQIKLIRYQTDTSKVGNVDVDTISVGAAPTPEPASLGMLAVLGGGLLARRRGGRAS